MERSARWSQASNYCKGEDGMFRGSRILTSLALFAALAAPAMIHARPVPQEEHRDRDRDRDHDRDRDRDHNKRWYDKKHRDYHEWGPQEDAAYRRWLAERHRKHAEFDKLTPAQQQAYWNWRHDHPDAR
jgi:Ni/Co efflux regulator RcnB